MLIEEFYLPFEVAAALCRCDVSSNPVPERKIRVFIKGILYPSINLAKNVRVSVLEFNKSFLGCIQVGWYYFLLVTFIHICAV